MNRVTHKDCWTTGQKVYGKYCGYTFEGHINGNTRVNPDGRSLLFAITLSTPISVFGEIRESIELSTNEIANELFFA